MLKEDSLIHSFKMLLRFKFPCDGVCGQRVWSVCVVRSLVRFCKWLQFRKVKSQEVGDSESAQERT